MNHEFQRKIKLNNSTYRLIVYNNKNSFKYLVFPNYIDYLVHINVNDPGVIDYLVSNNIGTIINELTDDWKVLKLSTHIKLELL
jgi:hypothetical protein